MEEILPLLRIVSSDTVVPHEKEDPLRARRLAEQIERDEVLKDPPIVAEMEGGRFVVLDGVSRVFALRQLGCRDILVQIVDYFDPALQLDTWAHLICADQEVILRRIEGLAGVKVKKMEPERAQSLLEEKEILCGLIFRGDDAYGIRRVGTLESQIALLNQIVDLYEQETEIHRVIVQSMKLLPWDRREATAIVIFPRYTPSEIIEIAAKNLLLPPGVTRHLIPARALRLNIELESLRSADSLEDKNRRLTEFITWKIRNGRIRFYPEPTFMFDE